MFRNFQKIWKKHKDYQYFRLKSQLLFTVSLDQKSLPVKKGFEYLRIDTQQGPRIIRRAEYDGSITKIKVGNKFYAVKCPGSWETMCTACLDTPFDSLNFFNQKHCICFICSQLLHISLE